MQYLSLSLKNPDPFQAGSIGSNFSKASSPVKGEIWVANVESRCFSESHRDEMWVFYHSRYPHRVPTGLCKTSRLLFSTHISPLAGLSMCGIVEPTDPAFQGLGGW